MNDCSAKYTPLHGWRALALIPAAVLFFQVAYIASAPWPLCMAGYLLSLTQLARLGSMRKSFYAGLAVGFLCALLQLDCFRKIFGMAAVPLWVLLAFWIGLFVALLHAVLARFGTTAAALLTPFLWTGLEYFRSELYYLKFSWLNAGYPFAVHPEGMERRSEEHTSE